MTTIASNIPGRHGGPRPNQTGRPRGRPKLSDAEKARRAMEKVNKRIEVTNVEDDFDDLIYGTSPPSVAAKPTGIRPPDQGISFDDNPALAYASARAKKELAHADLANLNYLTKSAQYLPRDDIRQATATAFSTVAQSLRSIPDNLERRFGVAPSLAETVGNMIDVILGDLSDELERMHNASAG
jgi:phage terminase Nu1 subunit (DNA packaging protein)